MGRKAVAAGDLWASICCGAVFADFKGSVEQRHSAQEDGMIFYLKGDCPSCNEKRPEVAHVQNKDGHHDISVWDFPVEFATKTFDVDEEE